MRLKSEQIIQIHILRAHEIEEINVSHFAYIMELRLLIIIRGAIDSKLDFRVVGLVTHVNLSYGYMINIF